MNIQATLHTENTYSLNALTRRELQTLQLSAFGKTAQECADALFISKRTVEQHLDNARRKFGCDKKRHLIAIYFQAINVTASHEIGSMNAEREC